MNTYKNHLLESSLSKIWKYTQDHDTGAITAFRTAEKCGDGDRYTTKQKRQRNKSLQAKLKALNYTVIQIQGKYPEGGVMVTETSFFVVDAGDKGNIRHDLIKLGEFFEQDAILYIQKGTVGNLIGTNSCKNNDLRNRGTQKFNKVKYGKEGKFSTSLIRGRPFHNENYEITEVKEIIFGSGVSAIINGKISEMDWADIEI